MAVYYNNEGDLKLLAGSTMYADNPIGSWVKNDMNTLPSGFLKEGDTISQSECPELYAKYGSTVPYKADKSELSEYETVSTPFTAQYDGFISVYSAGANGITTSIVINGTTIVSSSNATYGVNGLSAVFKKGDTVNVTGDNASSVTKRVAYYKKSLIIKAKHVPVPADFADSLVGYLGQETNYNLYPWSHVKSDEGVDINQDITIERNGWYSIDYTLTSTTDVQHTFTLRDFDAQGEVHTIMRFMYDKSGTFRQTFLVPLKAGTYRYSHGGIGTLSVYMNRRDFA